MEVTKMLEEVNTTGSKLEHHEILNDIQVLSNELESLYTHYSKRIRNVSEELSRERSKHKVYQLEIAENHHTIQMLTEQIDYLLKDIEVKHEHYLQVQHHLNVESVPIARPVVDPARDERNDLDSDNDIHKGIMPESDTPILATYIPEIRVIYESIPSDEKSHLEGLKNEVILLLMEANEYFLTESKVSTEVELNQHAFYDHIGWLQMQKKRLKVLKRERWHNKVWKFLWGKEEENNHPEIIKKLDMIEDQLVSYSTKFNEVKESLQQSKERGETTQDYLKKMTALYDELKKIEGYYEEKLHGLRSQVEECKQRENDLERQVDLLNEKYMEKQKEKSQREVGLERELVQFRKDIQSQSNKKNELYNKMKQQSSAKKKAPQVNPQFDEYGSIPMSSDSKRTMFNPNKYMR
jgi:chromosome segregation ATPase